MMTTTPRIRIEDLSPLEALSEQEMADIYGAGRKAKWTFSGQAMEVLEVRQVMSAVTAVLTPQTQTTANTVVQTATGVDPTVPEQMVPAVLQAIQQVRQQAGSLSNNTGKISFNSETARQQFLTALDGVLGSQLNGATSSSLQAAGLTVISRASAAELDAFLNNGTAASQDLLVLRLQKSSVNSVTVAASESDQLVLQGTAVSATISGTLTGSLEVTGDLVFGLDATGRTFVREGSSIAAATDVAGNVSAVASPNAQVGVSLSGTGHFTGSSQYVVNDGDAIADENLYLDMDALFSDFETNATISGDMDFDGVTASFSVPGLDNPIQVPAQLEWNPIEQTGDISIDERAVEEAVLEAVVDSVDHALEQLVERTQILTDTIGDIPVIGDEIQADVTGKIQSLLDIDIPESGFRDYLQDRGFQIDSMVGFRDLIEGNLGDLFVVTWHRHEVGSTISRTATGNFGKGLIDFKFDGSFSIQPEYDITVTFGVDAVGGVFIQEGSAVELTLTADATIDNGSASIPNLVNVHVTAHAPEGQHVVDASILAKVNDGDAQSGERLYATNLPASAFAVAFDAGIQVDATMSVDSPVQQLPSWIQSTLSGLLPDSITWTADVSYDVATDEFEYSINNTSLTDIVTAFQGADGVEGALKNYMLDQIAKNNPLPESTQQFLGTNIPLLEQNVMDLLDIPKAMQYVIAPLAFRGQPTPDVPGDTLTFGLELFRVDDHGVPINIQRMLTGETYDIISLDIDQEFRKDMAKITVFPETIVASYFGIVNATIEVTLTPGFFFDVDMLTGIDSLGFYVEGDMNGGAGNSVKPNFELGGKLDVDIIAEGDILYVADFLRVTGTIGIEAYGDFTFVSPHTDTPKMRVADINADQIAVGLGVDLTLQMHGEIGAVNHDQYDADVWLYGNSQEDHRVMPLYRHHDGTTLGDAQRDLAAFKEKLQSQGKQVIFAAAAATHDPHLVAAAISIIYKDSGMGEVVRKLVTDFNMRVDQAATAINRSWSELSAMVDRLSAATTKLRATTVGSLPSESEVTDQLALRLRDELENVRSAVRRIGDVASHLWNHCKNDLNEFAKAVKALGAETGEIVNQVWEKCKTHLNNDLNKFAQALNAAGIGLGRIATEVWNRVEGDLSRFAAALDATGAQTRDIAEEIWLKCRDHFGSNLNTFAQALNAANASTAEIADEVWNRCNKNLVAFAQALNSVKVGVDEIATRVWDKCQTHFKGDLKKFAEAMQAIGVDPGSIAKMLGERSKDPAAIAQALSKVVGNDLMKVANAMWKINWAYAPEIATGLRSLTDKFVEIGKTLNKSDVGAGLTTIADALNKLTGKTIGKIAQALGSVSSDPVAIAKALKTVDSRLEVIADAMWDIDWAWCSDIAKGLRGLTSNFGSIAKAIYDSGVSQNLKTIAGALYGLEGRTAGKVAEALGKVSRDAVAIAKALYSEVSRNLGTIAGAMWDIDWAYARDIAKGLRGLTSNFVSIAVALKGNVTNSLNTIADALDSLESRTVGKVAQGLGAVSSDPIAIARALHSEVTRSLTTIADAMWDISWAYATHIAKGLRALTSNFGEIAQALVNGGVTRNLYTIANALNSVTGASLGRVAWGLGAVTRNVSDIAKALQSVDNSASRIASAMWNWIDWTSYKHIYNALRALNVSYYEIGRIWRSI